MSKVTMNPKVDAYVKKEKDWRAETEALRDIVLASGLTEELKWGHPCYSLDGANVVLIHSFKAYTALLFFKGALMKDPRHLLIQQTENVQAGRQLRFTTVGEIAKQKAPIKAYVHEAIAIEKSGLKVAMKKTSDYPMPEEFKTKLKAMPELKAAFEALTPGRQRGYLYHFSQAKQSATRAARVENIFRRFFAEKGSTTSFTTEARQATDYTDSGVDLVSLNYLRRSRHSREDCVGLSSFKHQAVRG